MIKAGIIAEFNPFHQGHAYLIEQIRERVQADRISVVMSPDFVQRGEPAIIDKYKRCEIALKNGADEVYELPIRYALSSARDFAVGGIGLLDRLGCDYYCFGCETEDIDSLEEASLFLEKNPEEYVLTLNKLLKTGMSYPMAMEAAYKSCNPKSDLSFTPNNNLAMEYFRAARGTRMRPFAVKRRGMGYNDEDTDLDAYEFPSATAIRKKMRINGEKGVLLEHFGNIIMAAIRQQFDKLEEFKDVDEELANVMRRVWYDADNLMDFLDKCKTKNLTMARIKRCVLQIMLDIRKNSPIEPGYARLLGRRSDAVGPFSGAKDRSRIQIIGRVAKDMESLDSVDKVEFERDLRASELYSMISGNHEKSERKKRIIVVD
ncbi:tRNA(Met) cytidine acetate ligase [Eubacterium xylanophilum]|uniref:tRNA(Met) cytidine acetate ligase n=1 Tax=Eubacterium xylanophilum TaxID=39497 RepID=UPI000556A647|nr:nucleotidyltransferase family protein [Eubacterium xylanophilum]